MLLHVDLAGPRSAPFSEGVAQRLTAISTEQSDLPRPALLGRVIDASSRPLDGKGPLQVTQRRALVAEPLNPLMRNPIREPLDVVLRALNALH